MIYRVYCDGLLLYHSKLENLKIVNPALELEVNKAGKFSFAVYPDHPYFSLIRKLKSIITVYQDDYLLFRGRVLDEEIGWYNERKFTCEGELAFLLDSIQRPYEFTGTVADFLSMLVTIHNAQVDAEKSFTLGNVTVEGDVSISEVEHTPTWDVMQKRLLDAFGGYILIRHADGMHYLDYLSSINVLSPQKVRFGQNLLDLKRVRKGADVATVIIPLGAKLKDEEGRDTDSRLNIASVNGGMDFVQDADAIAQFGIIVKTTIFEDESDPESLKAKGQAQLADSVKWPETIDVTAADMAATGQDIASFHVATMVDAESVPHGLEQRFLISKLSLKLHEPGANRMTLGTTLKGFSDAVKGVADAQSVILQTVAESVTRASEAVYNVEQNLLASMQVTADNIQSSVAENYYLKDQTDALVSSVSTEITQTKDSFEIQFSQFSADIASVAAGTDAEFEEIRKYIRFVDGKILLGEVGNELELEIANDRISFLQDGAEVAYFSNRKLYITDAQVLHSLQIGGFAFMPRANGNTSFKKV